MHTMSVLWHNTQYCCMHLQHFTRHVAAWDSWPMPGVGQLGGLLNPNPKSQT
jgi:hypothetical protein